MAFTIAFAMVITMASTMASTVASTVGFTMASTRTTGIGLNFSNVFHIFVKFLLPPKPLQQLLYLAPQLLPLLLSKVKEQLSKS